MSEDWRTSYLGPPAANQLDIAVEFVSKAYGEPCYLVGSATRGKGWRDVDVRMIMSDEKYAALFGSDNVGLVQGTRFWMLTNTSISQLLSQASGLPVDFQIQQMTYANKVFPEEAVRHPLGMFAAENRTPNWITGKGLMKSDY